MTITRKDRGELLYLPDIMERTRMPEGTIRSRYHSGTMTCLWKFGRRLVAWEAELDQWMAEQQEATTKTRATGTQVAKDVERYHREFLDILEGSGFPVNADGHQAIRALIEAIHDQGYVLGQLHADGIFPEGEEIKIIRADGTVGHVRVLKSLEPSLDRQAQVAAAYWLFTPATRNGTPVAVRASLILSFNLH